MKKLVLFAAVILAFGITAKAQTIVSTTPSNRNVILEEYTGINCQYCPCGHKVANQLMANNAGRVWAINIHQGSLAAATPDFRTQWGNALASQAGINSYPSGTVNRVAFGTETSTVVSYNNWVFRASEILAQPSPVNVAATATIDYSTRVLTVDVEVYYTGNSNTAINYLNVALLQNNIIAPQIINTGRCNYPEMMVGNLYRHNRMLRHLLTGQWGDEITTTTTGTFETRQYTYPIPEHLNNIEYVLEDLEVVVYLAECRQYIVTGCEAAKIPENAAPYLVNLKESNLTYTCDDAKFYASVKNLWENENITSIDFEYSSEGTTYNFSWNNRPIAPNQTDTILFPTISITPNVNVPVSLTITAINGLPFSSNTKTVTLKNAVYEIHKNPTLKLYTDRYASEITVELYNSVGTVLLTEGPWTDLSAAGITEHIIPLPITDADCYKLTIFDSYGDGINSGAGAGHVDVVDEADNMIVTNNGRFDYELDLYFICDGLDGSKGNIVSNSLTTDNVVFVSNFDKYATDDENGVCKLTAEDMQLLENSGSKGYNCQTSSINNVEYDNFAIYPNPINETLIIQTNTAVQYVEIYNILGQLVQSASNTKSINVSQLRTGLYTVKVITDAGIKVEKIVKK